MAIRKRIKTLKVKSSPSRPNLKKSSLKIAKLVKFKPNSRQIHKKMPEWQRITIDDKQLLKNLNNRRISQNFVKKNARILLRMPPKQQLMLIPERISLKDLRIIDLWLCRLVCRPRFKLYRVRKNQKNLTKTEWMRFICAIDGIMASGVPPPTYQEFVNVHVQAMTTPAGMSWGAHGASNFLPWHREYLMLLEDRLRAFNPLVTIPYWDWGQDKAVPAELSNPDDMVRWGITRRSTIGTLPSQTQINNTLAQTTWENFRTSLEGIHNTVHVAVGGGGHAMGGANSPADPLFWLHHAFVDKIWADWQKISTAKPTNLAESLKPTTFFTRTVGQVMNTKSMGYVYM